MPLMTSENGPLSDNDLCLKNISADVTKLWIIVNMESITLSSLELGSVFFTASCAGKHCLERFNNIMIFISSRNLIMWLG